MGWAMLPICTWTVLMGQVLTLGVDMMNLLLSFVCCTSSQGRFKGSRGTASATRKMSLIFALDIVMKSCRFCSCEPKPKQQVEQEQDVDRINDWFWNPV